MTDKTKKIIVVGDGFVGKTCFVSKMAENKFITNYHATVGGKLARRERQTYVEVTIESMQPFVCS